MRKLISIGVLVLCGTLGLSGCSTDNVDPVTDKAGETVKEVQDDAKGKSDTTKQEADDPNVVVVSKSQEKTLRKLNKLAKSDPDKLSSVMDQLGTLSTELASKGELELVDGQRLPADIESLGSEGESLLQEIGLKPKEYKVLYKSLYGSADTTE